MTPDIVSMINHRSSQGLAEDKAAVIIRRGDIDYKEISDSLVDGIVPWETQVGSCEVGHHMAMYIVFNFVGCLASEATAPIAHRGTASHAARGDPCIEQGAIEGREYAGCCYPCDHGHRCQYPLDSNAGEHVELPPLHPPE